MEANQYIGEENIQIRDLDEGKGISRLFWESKKLISVPGIFEDQQHLGLARLKTILRFLSRRLNNRGVECLKTFTALLSIFSYLISYDSLPQGLLNVQNNFYRNINHAIELSFIKLGHYEEQLSNQKVTIASSLLYCIKVLMQKSSTASQTRSQENDLARRKLLSKPNLTLILNLRLKREPCLAKGLRKVLKFLISKRFYRNSYYSQLFDCIKSHLGSPDIETRVQYAYLLRNLLIQTEDFSMRLPQQSAIELVETIKNIMISPENQVTKRVQRHLNSKSSEDILLRRILFVILNLVLDRFEKVSFSFMGVQDLAMIIEQLEVIGSNGSKIYISNELGNGIRKIIRGLSPKDKLHLFLLHKDRMELSIVSQQILELCTHQISQEVFLAIANDNFWEKLLNFLELENKKGQPSFWVHKTANNILHQKFSSSLSQVLQKSVSQAKHGLFVRFSDSDYIK